MNDKWQMRRLVDITLTTFQARANFWWHQTGAVEYLSIDLVAQFARAAFAAQYGAVRQKDKKIAVLSRLTRDFEFNEQLMWGCPLAPVRV